jgi:hypothetical protein
MKIKLRYADIDNMHYDTGINKIDNFSGFVYDDAIKYAKMKYWLDRNVQLAKSAWKLIARKYVKMVDGKYVPTPDSQKNIQKERATFLKTEFNIMAPAKISRAAASKANLSPAEIRGLFHLLESEGDELDGFGSIGDSIIHELDSSSDDANADNLGDAAVVQPESVEEGHPEPA